MHTFADLWQAWPVVGPWEMAPLTRGTNSRVWRVTAGDGAAYVLRLLGEDALPRAQTEFALLRALAAQGLAFQVPLPIPARDGNDIVAVASPDGNASYASLMPWLPGEHPAHTDLSRVVGAARGLAALDAAFAALPEDLAPTTTSTPPFGDLTRWHPLIEDPLAAVARLPVDAGEITRVQTILAEARTSAAMLYVELPQQLIHRDYDPSNILMTGDRVTAVLDFEFAGRDLRVLDLAVALSWWPFPVMGTGQEWAILDAFGATYCQHAPLTATELRALPAVLRLRDATSLVHRTGRYLAGQENDERMIARVKHTLWREEWLRDNTASLLKCALTWSHSDI